MNAEQLVAPATTRIIALALNPTLGESGAGNRLEAFMDLLPNSLTDIHPDEDDFDGRFPGGDWKPEAFIETFEDRHGYNGHVTGFQYRQRRGWLEEDPQMEFDMDGLSLRERCMLSAMDAEECIPESPRCGDFCCDLNCPCEREQPDEGFLAHLETIADSVDRSTLGFILARSYFSSTELSPASARAYVTAIEHARQQEDLELAFGLALLALFGANFNDYGIERLLTFELPRELARSIEGVSDTTSTN